MFNIGDKVKVIYRSARQAEALVDGKRLVKYAIGTLVLKTNPDGSQELAVDYASTKRAEQVALGTFISIKKI